VTLKNITDGFKLKQSLTWGMILKKENLLIGIRTCFIDGDNDPAVFEGMVLNGYRGKGYTTEAYVAIIKFLRKANVKAIKAKTKQYNKPAISMLEKFGFLNVSNPNSFAYFHDNNYVFEKDLTQENSLLLTDTKIADNLSSDAYYKLSVKYYGENQYALANDCVNKAIAKTKNNADFYYQRGLVILASLGRLKALPDFQRALEINPKHANAIIESGNIMYELGNKSGGRELWNKAANLGSERAVKLLRNNPDWKQ
jgi:tetratricopeptide (TPR) repeat protein